MEIPKRLFHDKLLYCRDLKGRSKSIYYVMWQM